MTSIIELISAFIDGFSWFKFDLEEFSAQTLTLKFETTKRKWLVISEFKKVLRRDEVF
jgi:hypothetical protein